MKGGCYISRGQCYINARMKQNDHRWLITAISMNREATPNVYPH